MHDKMAIVYFRRFLRLHFMEESFLFLKEVEDFKMRNYVTPEWGSGIYGINVIHVVVVCVRSI